METGHAKHPAILWRWYAANALLLIAAVLIPVWLKAADARYPNYDLGIFAQALHRFSFADPNPFLGAINARVFSDHFDPILLPFAPLARLLAPDFAALLAEHLLLLLAPLPVILLTRSGRIPVPLAFAAIPFLFFNRGMLSALDFPVHPTTWAATFVMVFAFTLARGRLPAILLSAALLMACKEEYPFAVAMAGFGLLFGPRRKTGLLLLAAALLWLGLAFGLRPWLTGPTQPYAARILDPFLADPLGLTLRRLTDWKSFKRLFQVLLPLLPLFYWHLRARRGWNWPLLLAAMPLLAIRFVDQAWKFHYLAPIGAFALAVLFSDRNDSPIPRWTAVASLALLLGFGFGPVIKLASVYGGRIAPSETQAARRTALAEARLFLLNEKEGGVLAEGNLLPRLAAHPGVFQIGGVQRADGRTFRFVLAEKPPAGDPWPLTGAQVTTLLETWRRAPGTRIIRDDSLLFFAEGAFTE